MRIISGKHRSRIIKMVGIESTRETTDKVRGAIFNLILDYPLEGNGLDLFSGSGAMGLEALSRGLDFCYFNDINKKAYNVTLENIKALNYQSNSKVYNLDYKQCLKQLDKKLNFVFLDPPYDMDITFEIASFLYENELLKADSLIIMEVKKDLKYQLEDYFEVYKEREYGIRKVIILRLKK